MTENDVHESEQKGATTRAGYWFQTYTGREVYPLDMRAEDIDIRDIAHSLSLTCRFNGHSCVFWSVADHSLQVCAYLNAQRLAANEKLGPQQTYRLAWGLLHDASEAYLGDIVRPVKRSLPLAHVEDAIHRAISERFFLPWPMPEAVRHADEVLLATEARDFMATPPRSWGLRAQPWDRDLRMHLETWQVTERRFLQAAVNFGLATMQEAGLFEDGGPEVVL